MKQLLEAVKYPATFVDYCQNVPTEHLRLAIIEAITKRNNPRRSKVAYMALNGMLSNTAITNNPHTNISKLAVEFADELILELQK